MSDVLQQVVMVLSIMGFSALCGFGAYLGVDAAKTLLGEDGADIAKLEARVTALESKGAVADD